MLHGMQSVWDVFRFSRYRYRLVFNMLSHRINIININKLCYLLIFKSIGFMECGFYAGACRVKNEKTPIHCTDYMPLTMLMLSLNTLNKITITINSINLMYFHKVYMGWCIYHACG